MNLTQYLQEKLNLQTETDPEDEPAYVFRLEEAGDRDE